ncbi:hypothetical protein PIB30_075242 [Stylosanthes scabra]|uniref:Uncharacterized protein n=1 Tax=Stylosanthes scabra TaxID=79078 RepID=A0ABU6UQK8_9FABA|nr:hypothetical protein [Stylosanthes scabra]
MALPSSIIFRQYTSDDSFLPVSVPSTFVREYQIALTYAMDYDDDGTPTNGVFRPNWKVTPEAISKFKEKNPDVTVKVFISIGNNDPRFPFSPLSGSWITNATASINKIINFSGFKIDGIDVSYENVTPKSEVFVKYISQVITNLKHSGVITIEASISPSSRTNSEYYLPLYNMYPTLIDWVDYQIQNEEATVPDPQTLLAKYEELKGSYPVEKLLVGYRTVSPIVFFLGAMDILLKKEAAGISIVYNKPKSTQNQ